LQLLFHICLIMYKAWNIVHGKKAGKI
jgi:hypothetical protein